MSIAIETVRRWCERVGVPLNIRKSAILNIRYRKSSKKMIDTTEYLGIPVKSEYKYLGVWFNEFVNPMVQITKCKGKTDYLTRRLLMIPKISVTPKLLINLWTLIVRPIFDYAICLAEIDGTLKIDAFLSKLRAAFKKLIRVRGTIANTTIDCLMGYNPREYARWMVHSATDKWNNRRDRRHGEAPVIRPYKMEGSNLLISWPLLKLHNVLFLKCKEHDTFLSPTHLRDKHGISLPSITEVISRGAGIEKRIKEKVTTRKGRFFKVIDRIFTDHRDLYKSVCNLIA